MGDGVALATVSGPTVAHVDRVGAVFHAGWGARLAFDVHVGEGWLRPGSGGIAVEQGGRAGGAIVETSLAVPSGRLIHRSFAVATPGGDTAVVIEIENASAIPVAVAVGVEGPVAPPTVDGATIRLDGQPFMHLDRSPRDGTDAPPDRPIVIPVNHRGTVRVLMVGPTAAPWSGSPPPAATAVEAGWRKHLDRSMRVRSDDGAADHISDVALSRVLSAISDGSPAIAVVTAACRAGRWDLAGPAVDEVLFGLVGGELADDAQTDLDVLAMVGSWFAATGGASLIEAAMVDLLGAFDRLARGRRRSAGVDPALVAAAGLDLAAGIVAAGEPDAAAEVRRRIEQLDVHLGDRAVRELERLDRIRRHNVRFPSATDAGGHFAGGLADDPVQAAAALASVRALLVDDSDPGGLALVPALTPRWAGRGFDAHDVPTRFGTISFGVRWHGERPALLWDLEPHPGVDPDTVSITAAGLDPTWVGSGARGDALLRTPSP